MRATLIILTFAYVLSQFYRAFLAVLAAPLQADIGATAAQLSAASGYWFLTFALMQLPVGWALDTLGPRRTNAALLALGAGGRFGFRSRNRTVAYFRRDDDDRRRLLTSFNGCILCGRPQFSCHSLRHDGRLHLGYRLGRQYRRSLPARAAC